MTARLECTDLTGGRGSTTAFRHVDLAVDGGDVLALLGPNGAGKTTLLLTVAGLLPAQAGAVSLDGSAVRSGRGFAANRAGIVLVPDNRCLFPNLTVEEHLRVAARRSGPTPREAVDAFPALQQRWHLRAGALSGGEQQMLVMARAVIQQPEVLLIDELSMGLAPLIVETLFEVLRRVATEQGCAVVVVEQYVHLALQVADHAVVLNRGKIVLRGAASELAADPDRLQQAYFGASEPVGSQRC
ncbi:MAG TPA: ABC transporter ATP-binding protein [Acidimicrobiales bacterium]|nr:ABC transporter ATP-binding protein [Acidimicrobiales bacterium]